MEQLLRRSLAYESARWIYRQFVKYHHYPPPVLERAAYTPFSLVEKSLYASGHLSTQNLVLPNFIGIGAMKSGTTWLAGQLACHPEIFLPDCKEVHYLSWNFYRSLHYYSHFMEPGKGKVVGEFTVDYGGLPLSRIRLIHKLIPDAKLIFMMRNPIDRAWSHAKQELVFRTHRKYEEVREFEFLRRFKLPNSLHYGKYLRDIDNWTSIYPKESLFVGFYDDIKRDPRRLLTDVFRHIGVSTNVNWDDFPIKEVFRGGEKAPEMPEVYRKALEEIYADDIEKLYARFGEPVNTWRCQ